MAQRGRKPKPTAIKELEGNPGKRPLNDAEPKPERKAPPCPKWLEPEAKKEWRRLSKQLEQIGVLTEVDQAAFASYCQAYARWKEAEEFMTQHGTIVKTKSGYWQTVPQVSIAQTYLKIMNKIAGVLLTVVLLAIASSGCNTFRGVGKDLQHGGQAIERTAIEAQQK